MGWDWQEFIDKGEKLVPEPKEWKGLKASDVPPKPNENEKGKCQSSGIRS